MDNLISDLLYYIKMLNTLDIVFILIIVVAAVRCIIKGFVAEFMSFAAIILGIGFAVFFHKFLASILNIYIAESIWNNLIAFLIIFLLIYLIMKLFENAIHKFLESLDLEKLDKSLGLFLGLFEGCLIVSIIFIVLRIQVFVDVSELIEKSIISSLLDNLVPLIYQILPEGNTALNV